MTNLGSKWFVLKITKLFVMVFAFVFAFSAGLPYVFDVFAATPPNIITYQGRVLNSNGVPVSSATETMIFEMYDALSGGSCIWSNTSSTCATATGRSVSLTDGLFAEDLGDTGDSYAAITDTIFADNAGVYLQVTIGGETLTPRKRITAAPYAINSQTLDGLDSTDFDFEQIHSNDSDNIWALGVTDLDINLDSTGDFAIQDGGSDVFHVDNTTGTMTFSDDINITLESNGNYSENISISYAGTTDSVKNIMELVITDSASTDLAYQTALYFEKSAASVNGGTLDSFIEIHQNESGTSVDDAFRVMGGGTIIDAIDVSSSAVTNVINAGDTFLLFDGIRAAELSTGVFTFEDTSGNDLITITDAGTTGDLDVTGTLTVGTFACTGCDWDWDNLADNMTLDANTEIDFGTSDLVFTVDTNGGDFQLHSADGLATRFAYNGVLTHSDDLDLTQTNTENTTIRHIQNSTTEANALSISVEDSASNSSYYVVSAFNADEAGTTGTPLAIYLADNNDTDESVQSAFRVDSSAGGITYGLYAYDTDIDNAIYANNNFLLFDSIREAELSTGILTWEDTSGNDLMVLTDSGTTGALNITGTLSATDITCTDCLDFTELADAMTMDAATSITGAAGNTFTLSRTFTDATAETGYIMNFIASDTTSGTTEQYGLWLENSASTEGLDSIMAIYNADTDDSVDTGIAIGSASGGITLGIDLSSPNITSAVNFGSNFVIHDGIRAAELSTGTLTWEDTSGNDLMVLTDSGTTGALNVTGTLSATDITCTDCLDFAELADSMTLDSATSITGAAGNTLTLSRTLTDATAEGGYRMNFIASDTTSGTSEQYGLWLDNSASTEGLDTILVIANSDTDDTVDTGITIYSTGGVMSLGVDVSSPPIVDAIHIGQNFTVFDDIHLAELSTGVLTFEDSSGNDLMVLTDSGTTGALNITGTLSATDITCTDCLDFTELADAMTLDAATSITGAAGDTLTLSRTLTDATAEIGYRMNFIASDTTSSTSQQYGLWLDNGASTEGLDTILVVANSDTDDTVDAGIVVYSAGGPMTFGIELASPSIVSAVGVGQNFIKFDETRLAELSTGVLTFEDTSGNDLMVLTDNGTTGSLDITGTLSATDITCTDCLDFTEFADSMALDADTDIDVGNAYKLSITSDLSAANRTSDALYITQANDATYSSTGHLLNVKQFDTGTAVSMAIFENYGTGSSIDVVMRGDTIATVPSSSSHAAINVYNNDNDGMGFSMYTNNGATANAPLSYIFADNVAFDQDVSVVSNDGVAIGLHIIQNSLDAPSTAAIGNQALVIDVNEISSDDVIIIRSDADGTPDTEFIFQNDGTAYADGSWTGSGADYAEYFYTTDTTIVDSEVVCRDSANANAVKRCAAGEMDVVGVISNNPSFVANAGGAEAIHEDDANYTLVGLMGQIETKMTAADGAITVGDPISASSSSAGFAGRASGPTEIIGFALEPLASGTSTIKVLVNPQWYAGDVLSNDGNGVLIAEALAIDAIGIATSGTQGYDSENFTLRGSGWNGVNAQNAEMIMFTDVTDSADYRLSIHNGTSEVMHVSNDGDLAIAGRLYPSDEGVLQTDKYIYYEGAGDYMRTNAAGWATGSYDFAEMFPSMQNLVAGEVVVFGSDNESVARSGGTTYDQKIAGIVSTKPGFLAGESVEGHVPIALAGRVPTYVSSENGAIAPGDPLTTSSKPGYAMKATEAGPIVGYAMETFNGATGSIIVYVNNSYYDGGPVVEAPAADNVVSGVASVSSLDVSGNLNMNGGNILSVAGVSSFNGRWRIEENGDFYTYGRLVQVVNSHQNQPVETYATVSTQTTVELSGTVELVDGSAAVNFENIDPEFNDIISTLPDYRVFLTADGPTGSLYAINRTVSGFSIRENGTNSSATVDWMVIATHKDFEPEVSELLEDNIAGDPVVDPVIEPIVEPAPVEEPVVDPVIDEPEPVLEPVEEAVPVDPVEPLVEEPLPSESEPTP